MIINFKDSSEPKEAFPYKPPSDKIKKKFEYIFNLDKPLKPRLIKTIFDKLVAIIVLIIFSPILFFLKIAYLIEGLIDKDCKGPMFFYYFAMSGGKKIPKYKIRLIKEKFIEPEGAKKHDWIAYSAEWTPESRTRVGSFVKKYYLDEIPQFFSVIKGDMSIVGPRPLSVLHYERDLAQGNVTRKLLKGGLLGLGHINKGTDMMGDPIFEYEYIDKYINNGSLKLLLLDLWIIYKGIVLIFKGGGH